MYSFLYYKKAEIHDCTIALFNYLFSGHVSRQIIQELEQSKENRIEMQYYTRAGKVNLGELIGQTRDFVLEIEKIVDRLNPERIMSLQKKLKELASQSKKT